MTRRIRDVMSPAAVAVEPMTTVARAARLMREEDVGDVLVTYDSDLFGLLTDRDIVLRSVADGRDPGRHHGRLGVHTPARRDPRTRRHHRPRGRADATSRGPAAPRRRARRRPGRRGHPR